MNEHTYIKESIHSTIFGAYRKPRELNWISGVFMLFIILGFGLAGCQLPMEQKRELAEDGMPHDLPSSGEQLFRQHCLECHSFEGAGGNSAPDLTAYASRSWLIGFIQDPNAPKYYGNTDMNRMPGYDLEKEDLSNLVEFLLAQDDEDKEIDPVLKETGDMLLYENGCLNCHYYDGRGGSVAPTLDNFASDKWLRGLIEDPGQEEFFGEFYNNMPAYKDKLSKQEIDNLVYFLQSLRKKSH